MGYIISATVISPEMSSEGQVFIPIGVGIHLTENKDLLHQLNQYSEKAGQIKIQDVKAFSSPFHSA